MKVNTENKGKCRTTETIVIKETKIVVSSTEERRQYRKRKHRDTHYIKIDGQLVPVTAEVYDAYHYYENRGQTIAKKDKRNGVVSYDALDTEQTNGEEAFPDPVSMEDIVYKSLLIEQLYQYMEKLPEEDQLLLKLSYFDELPEQGIAEKLGIPKSTVNYHKARAIRRLRELFKI